MSEVLRKLSSRKLWMALAGVFTGIAMALGADSTDVSEVAGAVTAIVSVVTYIVTEGKIDAESVKNAIIEIQDGVDVIEGADGDA
jgi:phage shock protein PspC (stress-responsive transcriptional regulator)